MIQKIKLIKPLYRFISLKQIKVPEKFFGYRNKDVSFDFALFYLKNLKNGRLILKELDKESVSPGFVSRLMLNACHASVICAADVIEKSLLEYVKREPIVYMIQLKEVAISVDIKDIWTEKFSLLVYHHGVRAVL